MADRPERERERSRPPEASPSMLVRLGRAWRVLVPQQRRIVLAAGGLFATMFLPWYSKSAVGVARGKPVKVDDTLNAFQAFSFVEAAVLLVAAGVTALMFARGERRAFHLPGGDGTVVLAAGVWVCLLVFYRQLDKPSADPIAGIATTVGVSWGIFVTFLCGLVLAFAGNALRARHVAEPPLPGDVAPAASHGPVRRDPEQQQRPRPAADRAPTVVAPRGPRPGDVPAPDEPPELRVAPSTRAGRESAPPPRPAPPPAAGSGGDQLTFDEE